MIIIKDKPGQLCNRLWAFTPFISDALESNHKVIILHFYDYYKYFENLKIYKNIRFVKNVESLTFYNIIFKILNRIPESILLRFGVSYNCRSIGNEINLKNKYIFINSWTQIKPNKLLKLAEIQKLFLPKIRYKNKVDNFIFDKRKSFDLIIGVHIRRGDYKKYRNGRYFYTDSNYLNFLFQITKEFEHNKKIAFLLCSNEKINLEVYRNFSIFQVPNANLIEDLYALSKCDYIMGPQSTYSMWASFYGQKPLLFLKKTNSVVKIKEFSIVVSANRFENGNVFTH